MTEPLPRAKIAFSVRMANRNYAGTSLPDCSARVVCYRGPNVWTELLVTVEESIMDRR